MNRAHWPVTSGLAARGWAFLAGPVTSALIIANFTTETRGYHFTFAGLAAIGQLADFGLSPVIQQQVAHRRLTLPDASRFLFAWAVWIVPLVFIVLVIAGRIVLHPQPGAPALHWQGPWAIMSAAVAVDVWIQLSLAVLEGSGRVTDANTIRLVRNIAASATLWASIASGGGLWSSPAAWVVGVVLSAGLIIIRTRWVALQLPDLPASWSLWRASLAGLQWRIALSSIAGVLQYGTVLPIVFRFVGPTAAGRMGLTWGFIEATSIAATTWLAAASPGISRAVAQFEHAEARRMALRATIRGGVVLSLGGVFLLAGIPLISLFWPGLPNHFVPGWQISLLLAATSGRYALYAMTIYTRAHMAEPLLPVFLLSAILTAAGVTAGALSAGTGGAAAGYCASMLVSTAAGLAALHRMVPHGRD